MSLETQIANLVAATNQLTGEVSGKMAQIDQRVEQKRGELDAWKAGAINKIVASTKLYFDPSIIYDKPTLMGADGSKVDPADNTRSKWIRFGSEKSYFSEGSLVQIHLPRYSMVAPGDYEAPQYSSDQSMSVLQFIVANIDSTSEQINARLAALGVIPGPGNVGIWWEGASYARTTVVQIAGLHPYSGLFARFVNVRADAAGPGNPQAITFGGTVPFRVGEVDVYPNISANEV